MKPFGLFPNNPYRNDYIIFGDILGQQECMRRCEYKKNKSRKVSSMGDFRYPNILY